MCPVVTSTSMQSRVLVVADFSDLMNLDCFAGSLTTAAAMTEISSPLKFVSVWGHNFDKTVAEIQTLMTSREDILIGMDAEFCAQDGPWRPWTEP